MIDDYVKVDIKFTNEDQDNTRLRHQELPAVFVDAALSKLVSFTKPKEQAWKSAPYDIIPTFSGQTAQGQHTAITESWAAYVDEHDFGIGVMNPRATGLTHYRVIETQDRNAPDRIGPQSPNTSYFALTTSEKIALKFEQRYEYYIKVGSIDSIRRTFTQLYLKKND